MFQSHSVGNRPNELTWIVVANRAGARILESRGGGRDLHIVQELQNPQGRLKNREIESDRDGSSKGEGGADYPMHGLVNKGAATFHLMRQFAGEVAEALHKGRSENAFSRLVLVAEPRMLGELKGHLDRKTESCITRVIEKEWAVLSLDELKTRIQESWIPAVD